MNHIIIMSYHTEYFLW